LRIVERADARAAAAPRGDRAAAGACQLDVERLRRADERQAVVFAGRDRAGASQPAADRSRREAFARRAVAEFAVVVFAPADGGAVAEQNYGRFIAAADCRPVGDAGHDDRRLGAVGGGAAFLWPRRRAVAEAAGFAVAPGPGAAVGEDRG